MMEQNKNIKSTRFTETKANFSFSFSIMDKKSMPEKQNCEEEKILTYRPIFFLASDTKHNFFALRSQCDQDRKLVSSATDEFKKKLTKPFSH